MNEKADKLIAILSIGHETSMRGQGLPLKQALSQVDYLNVRKQFCPQDLVPLIKSRKAFIKEWIMFSEDKRTSCGYYITEAGVIGQVNIPEKLTCTSIEEAVAEYVVKELDFWANLKRAAE